MDRNGETTYEVECLVKCLQKCTVREMESLQISDLQAFYLFCKLYILFIFESATNSVDGLDSPIRA